MEKKKKKKQKNRDNYTGLAAKRTIDEKKKIRYEV